MASNILKYIVKAMDYSKSAVIGFKINTNKPFLHNLTARKIFGDENGNIDIDRIFSMITASEFWKNSIEEQLNKEGSVTIYDISILTINDVIKISDVQIGYADDDKKVFFIEFFFKEDTRMAQAISQINQSPRAEGILVLDENLSVIHCNDLFYGVFEADNETSKNHINTSFSNGFQPKIKEQLLSDILKNLDITPTFFTKLKVITSKGIEKWYSLELQRRTLDDTGIDKVMAYLVNIDNQIEIEEKLDMVNQYFNAMQDLSEDMLYRVDLKTKTLYRYRSTEQSEMYGLNPVMPNYPHSILLTGIIHAEDEDIYMQYGNNLLNGIPTQIEIRIKSTTGEYEFNRLTCSPVYGENGEVKEMFGKIINIQTVRELEEQANFDSLTKLLNKRAILESTTNILSKSKETEQHALFFMDLDDFKYVNDNLGHSFGDFLLAELGKRLRDGVRQHDLVGRVGGDEFVIFLRDIPNIEMILGKAKLILSTISEDFYDGSLRHTMHGSLGVALYPEHGSTYEELYHHADLALYSSKHKGKNQVTMYSKDLED